MRTDIHPKYEPINVACSCGNKFTVRSTYNGDLRVEICANCHPFYTGQQKLIDTAGRVEDFKRRFGSFSTKQKQADKEADKS